MPGSELAPLRFRTTTWDWSRVYVVGIVNVTPDSFSDGGSYFDTEAAVRHGVELARAGADLLDVGGESTRPGAAPVPADEQLRRVGEVIRRLSAEVALPISVDTTSAEVAGAALGLGAEVINDISGGLFDRQMFDCLADAAAYICGHVRGRDIGTVHANQGDSGGYEGVRTDLDGRLRTMSPEVRRRTVVDPGLGFGKVGAINLELCRRAGELSVALQCPVMVGPSRKRFIADGCGSPHPVDARLRDCGSIGAGLASVAAGAHAVRVHDVAGFVAALRLFESVRRGRL